MILSFGGRYVVDIPFVELSRQFAPVDETEEANLDIGRIWGPRIGCWLDWDRLLEYRRVVLLAEADSGKTLEFRAQVWRLRESGKAAFFARVEDVADGSLTSALDDGIDDAERFAAWRDGGHGELWLFLDSIDEARLNRKRLDTALRQVANELGSHRERAHVFVSCRVSDWQGREDRETLRRYLPAHPIVDEGDRPDADPLLDPIFLTKQPASRPGTKRERPLHELLVVRIVPLDTIQRGLLARSAGVHDESRFIGAIYEHGLDPLADRPGDLIELAMYWTEKGERFSSLVNMVDHAVETKLRDKPGRSDGAHLAPQEARHGAERLAAALTLGKTFTLRAGDTVGTSASVDPAQILPEWSDAKMGTLLRRGVFAPSTYGRVRFHHRSTQEYLAASWLRRLIDAGCPKHEIHALIFAEPYGMKTVVPSLQASAAWLALSDPQTAEEVLEREPLVLIRHGDPRSLPLDIRRRLLLTFAEKDAKGEIANGSVDHHRLSLFADPALGSAIRDAWSRNPREGFRSDLLRLIREGRIVECVDLARDVPLAGDEYIGVHAVEALVACEDAVGLEAAASWLKAEEYLRDPIAGRLAELLFPRFLTVENVLELMRRTRYAPHRTVSGFHTSLGGFWDRCPDDESRLALCEGLGRLCLEPPFVSNHARVSARFQPLAKQTHSIARRALTMFGDRLESERLVPLLMATERARSSGVFDDEAVNLPSLGELIESAPKLKETLFWADVEEIRRNDPSNEVADLWGFRSSVECSWEFRVRDREWLERALRTRDAERDRRLALAALLSLAKAAEHEKSGIYKINANDADRLCALVAVLRGESVEQDLLQGLRLPPPPQPKPKPDWQKRQEKRQEREAAREAVDKASWVDFRNRLMADPVGLRDLALLRDWGSSAQDLWSLTRWLGNRAKRDYLDAPIPWRLLEEGFGRAVAEAYRDGMTAFWRLVDPVPSTEAEDDGKRRDRPMMLAFRALGVEASEGPNWASRLTPSDASRAARHVRFADQGYPLWFEALVETHPMQTLPELRAMMQAEWLATSPTVRPVLWRCRQAEQPIPSWFAKELLELMITIAPASTDAAAYGLVILNRLPLDPCIRSRLWETFAARFETAKEAGHHVDAVHQLAALFLLDADTAAPVLTAWMMVEGAEPALQGSPAAPVKVPYGHADQGGKRTLTMAEQILADLFGRHHGLVPAAAVERACTATVVDLLALAYRFVRREVDVVHEGGYSPDARDEAEGARSILFAALLGRKGGDAYSAMRDLAKVPDVGLSAVRLAELAHSMGERDAEPPPWTAREVVTFEDTHTLPAKTGSDLMRVVLGVLKEITADLAGQRADAFPRTMVTSASQEYEIQQWLAHELKQRSKGRYSVHREVQIARGDKPDTVIASSTASVEVAIELKYANNWTVTDLEEALVDQLAERYLRPDHRRHGILVLSLHKTRLWKPRNRNGSFDFGDLIRHLSRSAQSLQANSTGPIEVEVVGLDASAS